jgi:hypothetical protein
LPRFAPDRNLRQAQLRHFPTIRALMIGAGFRYANVTVTRSER